MAERRTFLKWVAGGAGAVAAGATVIPAVALVAEPGQAHRGGPEVWTRVSRLDALDAGKPAKVTVVGAEVDAWTRAPDRRLGAVWLIRDGDNAVRAFSAVCPHLGCAIDLAQEQFVCPCHDSYFELSGARKSGPSPRGMDPLEVKIESGWVLVKYAKFRQGTPERVGV